MDWSDVKLWGRRTVKCRRIKISRLNAIVWGGPTGWPVNLSARLSVPRGLLVQEVVKRFQILIEIVPAPRATRQRLKNTTA